MCLSACLCVSLCCSMVMCLSVRVSARVFSLRVSVFSCLCVAVFVHHVGSHVGASAFVCGSAGGCFPAVLRQQVMYAEPVS